MNSDVFSAAIGDIYAYFQTKTPAQSTLALWFEDVKHIPSGEPLRFVVGSIKNMETMPRNMAKAFRTGWDSWKRVNQNKIQSIRRLSKTSCDSCDGSGLIFFHAKTGYPCGQVCRCASCRNWEGEVSEVFPASTVRDLEARGFIVDNRPKRDMPATRIGPVDMTRLADGIGN